MMAVLPTCFAVVEHYDALFSLNLSRTVRRLDLVEFLKSL